MNVEHRNIKVMHYTSALNLLERQAHERQDLGLYD